MKTVVVLLLLVQGFVAFSPSALPAATPPPPVVFYYEKAESDFAALRASTNRQKYRENYAMVLERYRKVFEGYPKTRQAELALLRAGQLYTLQYKWTKQKADLNRAQNYYQRLIENYPRSSLVDDAQIAIGYLYLNQYQDPSQAYLKFRDAVRFAPAGDRTAEAARQAQKLARYAPPDLLPATANAGDPACPPATAATRAPVPAAGSTPQKTPDAGSSVTRPPSPPVAPVQSPALSAAATAATAARITGIRHWSNPEYSRVVIDLDQPTNFYANLLDDKSGEGKPPRLYLDLFSSRVEGRFCQPIPVNDGILLTIRAGQNTAESVRVVLDIDRLHNYRIFPMENPFRIVADVTGGVAPGPASAPLPDPSAPPASAASPLAEPVPFPVLAPLPATTPAAQREQVRAAGSSAASAPAASPETAVPPYTGAARRATAPVKIATPTATPPTPARISLAQQLGLGVRRVVIDAGHGAQDPGAIGIGGLQEKDVTLDLALRVRDLLREAGFETILTRDRDIYLPLEERTALANTARGDLFLSLHCNASDAGNLNGVETYFLNLASSRRAMTTAARENSMSVARMSDLEHILKAIFSSKMDESSRFAELVQKSLHGAISRRYRNVPNLGVKQAPFYVLIGAEMPSILAEVSFINHKVEGKRLAESAYRQVLAAAIADGVKRYSRSVKSAALGTKAFIP